MEKEIKKLLKQRNGIILAHNYQLPEIQEIADLCGDSLELSIKASETNADVIVFCGVHFMAETSSILSPNKKVLLPVLNAGCPMADMITPEALSNKLESFPPDMPVVTYVNSTASVKALSTICCTSANSIKVVNSLNSSQVLMIPDKNLAQYTAAHTEKKVQLWEGYCPVHNNLSVKMVNKTKEKYPDSIFIAHPECKPEVLDTADAVMSTSGMLNFAKESPHNSFIIGTEIGILYPLQKENPNKQFIPASPDMVCEDMKKIRLKDVLNCLKTLTPEVKVPLEIQPNAIKAVRRMISIKK